jgi:acyl-CoA synthetase (AMP-forming)/AMP-acid ligase II
LSAFTHPRQVAAAAPDKPALIMAETGAVLTYAALATRANQAAHLFAQLGLARGDTVAILVENQIRFPELIWAAKDSGLRYVPVSTHLNGLDAAYVIEDCGARLLIASWALREVARDAAAALGGAAALLMTDGAEPPFASYEALAVAQPTWPLEGRGRGASMLYSSGTTGRPKGVRTEIADVRPETPPARFAMLLEQYQFDASSVFVNPGPWYHAAPLRFMMTVHRAGGTVIGFLRFDASSVLQAIAAFRATHGFFVPTMFRRMLRLDDRERAAADVFSMRHAVHSGAPCPPDVKRAMINWWGPVIDELYGGTESIGHTFISSVEWLARPGSVGKPSGACEIRIVDEQGRPVSPGVPGRIVMRNGLKVAYHGRAAAAPLQNAEGFASMGDVGYLDDEGYLYLTDRESHTIIVGGVNVYPQEAEAVLADHPAVGDVAVIGVPNVEYGEEVKAVVLPVTTPDDPAALEAELVAWCRERLSSGKCPRSVDFVDSLPRNDMGKLVKRSLRERYWAGTGRAI